jgi:hypothetical protein
MYNIYIYIYIICNCLLKHVSEGKMGVTRRRWKRGKQLLDGLEETRGWWELKEEALARTLCRTRSAREYGPVVRWTTAWMRVILFLATPWRHIRGAALWLHSFLPSVPDGGTWKSHPDRTIAGEGTVRTHGIEGWVVSSACLDLETVKISSYCRKSNSEPWSTLPSHYSNWPFPALSYKHAHTNTRVPVFDFGQQIVTCWRKVDTYLGEYRQGGFTGKAKHNLAQWHCPSLVLGTLRTRLSGDILTTLTAICISSMPFHIGTREALLNSQQDPRLTRIGILCVMTQCILV